MGSLAKITNLGATFKGLARELYLWPILAAGQDPSGNAQILKTDSNGTVKTTASTGTAGATYYGDTSAHTGTWSAVQVITTATFTTFTGTGMTGFTGVAFPVGTVIYGDITAITLTSGSVVAYNA